MSMGRILTEKGSVEIIAHEHRYHTDRRRRNAESRGHERGWDTDRKRQSAESIGHEHG